ncbi:succinate dehydrogenase/fumarate reductase flavoprotein subunit [Lactobacillus colini]|uniref:Succinate dehydrogenase/fumarate reductase flavoprotein subunit n=1 Tax=Lactobacillus colini TaxID=1819254 RepID=A0ABS4MEW1_9LACO|nr:FAD-dependent oxidoreductase [Lactobacillus colini]MBP2058225.1 succinate dehydrogenase/fumarate reductase flavoprotein subunit [Lactobacillus colini]
MTENKEQHNTDVLVVGAGDSGMMAAAAAREAGVQVTVIEKEGTIGLLRLSNAAVNSNAQKRAGVTINKAELVEYLASFAQHNVDQKLLNLWADHSAETVNWLEDNILKPNGAYMRSEPDAMVAGDIYKAFPTENDPTIDGKSYISYGDWFVQWAKDHKIDMRYHTELIKLIKDGDTVTGAIVKNNESGEEYQISATNGVILCTGGYSANKDLLKKWNPEALKKNVYNDSPRNNGGGIIAALEVGALRDQEPAECIFDRGLVPAGTKTEDMYYQTETYDNWLWIGSYPFLKVNLRGNRFANESVPYQFITNAASKEPGYLYAMIWDADYADRLEQFHMLGCAKFGFPGYMKDKQSFIDDVDQYVKKGLVVKADTIEELAEKLHLPVENLKKTVERQNQNYIDHVDRDFGKEYFRMSPIKSKPYYGCILGGRILGTLDGLRVNEKMEVLDEDYEPINHLYTAGNDSGAFFWGSYPDRVPGLCSSHAQTFGRLAGKNAAKN